MSIRSGITNFALPHRSAPSFAEHGRPCRKLYVVTFQNLVALAWAYFGDATILERFLKLRDHVRP